MEDGRWQIGGFSEIEDRRWEIADGRSDGGGRCGMGTRGGDTGEMLDAGCWISGGVLRAGNPNLGAEDFLRAGDPPSSGGGYEAGIREGIGKARWGSGGFGFAVFGWVGGFREPRKRGTPYGRYSLTLQPFSSSSTAVFGFNPSTGALRSAPRKRW
jgi:hypothetical protein